ncbi:hypothetical protein J4E85_006746 [Alternaria conjuncta]|uniref:uncharacterized protein n=1 Tax=Alternaria conjuncta TaxID=181017 RepID=UPI00221EBB09|nr:uncharacterized protein J4E85_006746 [Alternaria conjuncta]KAI4926453.1 hypothetical protein J4E85_006746 [Alternaria conjuncta]
MAAIFGDILGPRKLRSVAAEEKNDSSNPRAGTLVTVCQYQELVDGVPLTPSKKKPMIDQNLTERSERN